VTEACPGLPSKLIQVVSRFRPDADGVGETALNLADALLRDHGIVSRFLVYNPPRAEPVLEMPDGLAHTIECLPRAHPADFNNALDRLLGSADPAPVVLLHYVPYGFSDQGTPFWLARSMERAVGRGARLVTLFHELYALPRFPTRTMITSWIQRRIFPRLLAPSESAFTSSEDFLAILRRRNDKHRPINLIGICSSAGEPAHPRLLKDRRRRLTVFGRFATRQHVYANLPALERIVQHLGIEEIADIGPIDDARWLDATVGSRFGSRLRVYGTLSVPAASQLLEDSLLGALAYPYFLRGKSSVFAAYQAHSTAILLLPGSEKNDLREPGSWSLSAEELLALPAQSLALFDRLQEAAGAGHEHYKQYRSARSMAATLLPALRAVASNA
jgi:hypothetical protein